MNISKEIEAEFMDGMVAKRKQRKPRINSKKKR